MLALFRFSLPVPVRLKRLADPLWVFIFGISKNSLARVRGSGRAYSDAAGLISSSIADSAAASSDAVGLAVSTFSSTDSPADAVAS